MIPPPLPPSGSKPPPLPNSRPSFPAARRRRLATPRQAAAIVAVAAVAVGGLLLLSRGSGSGGNSKSGNATANTPSAKSPTTTPKRFDEPNGEAVSRIHKAWEMAAAATIDARVAELAVKERYKPKPARVMSPEEYGNQILTAGARAEEKRTALEEARKNTEIAERNEVDARAVYEAACRDAEVSP